MYGSIVICSEVVRRAARFEFLNKALSPSLRGSCPSLEEHTRSSEDISSGGEAASMKIRITLRTLKCVHEVVMILGTIEKTTTITMVVTYQQI